MPFAIILLTLGIGVMGLGFGIIALVGIAAEYIAEQQKAETFTPINLPAFLWVIIPVGLMLTLTSIANMIVLGVSRAVY